MITEKVLTHEEALRDFNKIIETNSIHPILGTYDPRQYRGQHIPLNS